MAYRMMAYRSDTQTKLQQRARLRQQQLQPKAREVLLSWARARKNREQVIRYLKLARFASDSDVRDRVITIASHYRALMQSEERISEQKGINWLRGAHNLQ